MSAANWYADPTGRHAQRYWDGQRWTGHVAGADGVQAEDPQPLDASTSPPGAPTATQPSAAAPAPGQVHENWSAPAPAEAAPAAATTSTSGGFSVTPGLILSAIGAVATLVAMLALDWLDVGVAGGLTGEGGGISDINDIVSLTGPFSPDVLFLSEWFFSFGWIVALIAAVAALATSFVSALKLPVAAVCALSAAWAVVATFDVASTLEDDFGMGTSFDPALGLWVGVGGLVVAAVGALISKPATS